MPADFKLDPATGDFVIEANQFVLIYDDDSLIQRLKFRLQDVLGEWFRDTTVGTDWFGSILGKRSDLARRTEIRRRLLETPGVSGVSALALDYTPATRALAVEFTVVKDDGLPLDVRFDDLLAGA